MEAASRKWHRRTTSHIFQKLTEGYQRMMIIFVFFMLCQIQIINTQFNLYHTDRSAMMNTYGHDCFYVDWSEDLYRLAALGSFCIRSEHSDEEDKLCYGTSIIFKELKTKNIHISDLFHWNAVIEIIDLYEKYLRSPNLVNENEVYCNCSILTWFGKSCRYQIDIEENDERSFSQLVHLRETSLGNTEFKVYITTCYIGIRCQTNLICLDWRQICNGIVDCDHAEDEPADLCLQMETNQCHPENEFRCQNGLCIPITMASTALGVCPDLSDLKDIFLRYNQLLLLDLCFSGRPLECDDINLGWKQFSCNNGRSIPYSHVTSDTGCVNDYHLEYLRKLFSTNNESDCWKSMICLTGFQYLYSHLDCSNHINIERSCSNEFYFPSNSIVYSFVYFLYDQNNRTDWFKYPGPNSICYQKEFCLDHTFNVSTFLNGDLTCFSIDQTSFSWENFYEYVLHLFSPCFSSSIPISMNHPLLYPCNRSQSVISIYRLKDKNKDCFFNEDEDENIDLCSFNTNDLFKCLSNPNQCVRESSFFDDEYDCADGSDEYFEKRDTYCGDRYCGYRPWGKRSRPEIYRFDELCNYVVDRQLFSLQSNETDETDCEHWPYTCSSYYTTCNELWNCPDGSDEKGYCFTKYASSIQATIGCQSNEHYCIQLTNHNDVNPTCIHLNQTGDGIVDCIGGTDERFASICNEKYSTEFNRRFHCMNSSLCIRPNQVCDTIVDCPFHDDELICPWLLQNNSSAFYCRNSPLYPVLRCNNNPVVTNEHCKMREDIWFCDLRVRNERIDNYRQIRIEQYPPFNKNIKSISYQSADLPQLLTAAEKRTFLLMNINQNGFLCNFGYSIKSSILKNKTYCLCPPAYYGDYCQYQSERVTVSLRIQARYSMNRLTVFRLMLYLLNENHLIVSYNLVVVNHANYYNEDKLGTKLLVHLMSEKMTNLSLHQRSKSKFARIDSYIIKQMDVQYICSWFFPVPFPFLPVNQLAADLYLVNESFKVIYCKKHCGTHGKCSHYINAKDKEYCWCSQGWFGESCQLKSSSCHSTSCSPDSQCIILNEEKKQIQCICPLGKSGDQCYITHNPCVNNPCQTNETCLPLDQRKLEYTCTCHDDYNAPSCKIPKWSYISIDDNLTEVSTIPALIIIFGHRILDRFSQTYRVLHKDVKIPTILRTRSRSHEFGFVQMFHNFSKSFYYVISIRSLSKYTVPITTDLIPQHLCRNVSELFNQTILNEFSYLKRLKLYHLPCNRDHNLRCFLDEYRMCVCTKDHNSHCFFYNHEYGHCNHCQNDGLCVSEDPNKNPWNFVCLCPKCTYGFICQFAPKNYFITFDMLIGVDMKTGETSLTQQPTVIHLTLTFLLFILIISLIVNTISIIVFYNKKLRQVGCDLYLLNLTIISEIGLILLFLRFIYMVIIQMYIIENLLLVQISCISLEYLIRLIPSLFDWLTVCISIERAYTVIKNVHFTKIIALKTLKLSRWIILIVFVLNILTTLHRPFHLRLFDEPTINGEPRGHPWCVLDLGSTSWGVYEKFINLFHLISPFVLNLLSVIGFLLYKMKFELVSAPKKGNKDGKLVATKKQLLKYKPLIISPTVILILEIPRFVLTFTLACIDHAWQRYVYLIGYLISFLPLTGVLFIYILPSPKYKEALKILLKKTFLGSLLRST